MYTRRQGLCFLLLKSLLETILTERFCSIQVHNGFRNLVIRVGVSSSIPTLDILLLQTETRQRTFLAQMANYHKTAKSKIPRLENLYTTLKHQTGRISNLHMTPWQIPKLVQISQGKSKIMMKSQGHNQLILMMCKYFQNFNHI